MKLLVVFTFIAFSQWAMGVTLLSPEIVAGGFDRLTDEDPPKTIYAPDYFHVNYFGGGSIRQVKDSSGVLVLVINQEIIKTMKANHKGDSPLSLNGQTPKSLIESLKHIQTQQKGKNDTPEKAEILKLVESLLAQANQAQVFTEKFERELDQLIEKIDTQEIYTNSDSPSPVKARDFFTKVKGSKLDGGDSFLLNMQNSRGDSNLESDNAGGGTGTE